MRSVSVPRTSPHSWTSYVGDEDAPEERPPPEDAGLDAPPQATAQSRRSSVERRGMRVGHLDADDAWISQDRELELDTIHVLMS